MMNVLLVMKSLAGSINNHKPFKAMSCCKHSHSSSQLIKSYSIIICKVI